MSTTKLIQASLNVKNNEPPSYFKQYKLPYYQKEEIAKQIQSMLDNKVIEEAQSEWNSPILLVPKKSSTDKKKWRLVVDYRNCYVWSNLLLGIIALPGQPRFDVCQFWRAFELSFAFLRTPALS